MILYLHFLGARLSFIRSIHFHHLIRGSITCRRLQLPNVILAKRQVFRKYRPAFFIRHSRSNQRIRRNQKPSLILIDIMKDSLDMTVIWHGFIRIFLNITVNIRPVVQAVDCSCQRLFRLHICLLHSHADLLTCIDIIAAHPLKVHSLLLWGNGEILYFRIQNKSIACSHFPDIVRTNIEICKISITCSVCSQGRNLLILMPYKVSIRIYPIFFQKSAVQFLGIDVFRCIHLKHGSLNGGILIFKYLISDLILCCIPDSAKMRCADLLFQRSSFPV